MTLETSKTWNLGPKIDSSYSYEDILNIVLEKREIKDKEKFLTPKLEDIPTYEKLYDCLSAAEKILKAVKEKKKIVVYGDYDVDGITGTCILWSFLYFELLDFLKIKKEDISILPYIPDRVEDGYGLSKKTLDKLKSEDTELIVTVDCGIRDKELIKEYPEIEFVVTDHHLPPDDILEGLDYTLVHQMYPGKEYPYESVCGAFVVYLLVLSLKNLVGLDSSFESNKKFLDLVALATVADIMPLNDVNRVLVKYGLETLQNTSNLGLKKLAKEANLDLEKINTYHLGFVLGPRLNASGRLDLGMHALKLLCVKEEEKAVELARKLDALNKERQKLTFEMYEEAQNSLNDDNILIAKDENWNEGVIGLVASKLQEKYNRPVIVFTKSGDEFKGSARSIKGVNITEIIEKFSHHLTNFGGHEQAAGLSLQEDSFDAFVNDIISYANENISEDMFEKVLDIDLVLDSTFLTHEFVEQISRLEPFGYGNKKPIFMLENIVVVDKKVMGNEKNHIKITFKGNSTGVDEAVLFNCSDDVEKIKEDDTLDLVGSVGINEWNGESKIQFEVKEWKYCNN